MKRILTIFILLNIIIYPQSKWEKLDGPKGGFTGALYITGDTILYSSLIPSNVYFSTNRGNSWHGTNLKIKDRVVDFIKAPNGFFLAAASESGIYKSSDLVNWEKIPWSLKVEHFGATFSDKIFASLLGDPAYGSVSGIYSSTDSGLNWDLEYNSLYTINDILLRPDSSVIIGAYTKILIKKDSIWTIIPMLDMEDIKLAFDGDSLIFASSHYFRYSTDNGSHWIEGDQNSFILPERMYDLIFNHRVIGAFGDQTNWGGHGWGIAVTDDSGKTWRWSNTGLPPYTIGDNLAKSGTDTYLGTWGSGVFKSTDFGDSWSALNNGIYAAEVMDILFTKDSTVYTAAWASGLSKSTDFGKSWKMINKGVNNTYFYCINSDAEGNLYAGSEKGLFKSTDEGETWNITSFTGFAYRIYKDNINNLYVLNFNSGLYRSTDQGNTFTKINNGSVSDGVWSFAVDSSGNLYAGTENNYIYKSTDQGATWITLRNSANGTFGINDIFFAPNGYIFASTFDEGVLRSTDNGLTWQQLKTGSSWKYVSGLGVNKEGLIFVSLKENTYIDAKEIMYVSSDYGETFKNCTGDLQLVYVKNVKFDNENRIWLGSRDGIYVADIAYITDIKPDNNVLVKQYHLSQNYPNPFNPSTEIKYSIPISGPVSIKVFDILGKEVTSLVNEEKPAGEYSVTFNANKYPSGVYFYTIHSGNFTETKKLLLLK